MGEETTIGIVDLLDSTVQSCAARVNRVRSWFRTFVFSSSHVRNKV